MLFTSLTFVIFFILLFLIYYMIPRRFQWILLLVASYAFYMNLNLGYGILLFLTTLLTYVLGIKLSSAAPDKRKYILLAGILPLVAILFFYKTINPLILQLNELTAMLRLPLQPFTKKLALPAGISFYFFQSMGYLIDVYRGKIKPEKHFGHYALFVSFFPQLLAGPIGRADSLLPQYKKEHPFDYAKAAYGIRLVVWGYFKKLVIADVFANVVDKIYNNVTSYVGLVLIIATAMFAIEIYCDFSGYSDIAIGTAKMLGIDLMTNFKSPYCSFSVKEFWSRWHISLSTWFRDYVYIPLGGNRKGTLRRDLNLFLTFLVSGFWHGSSLTFLCWGGIHGVLQIIENHLFPAKRADGTRIVRKKHWWQWPVTIVLLGITWVFFRANSLNDAVWIFTNAFHSITHERFYIKLALICLELPYLSIAGMFLSVVVLMIFDILSLKTDVLEAVGRLSPVKRYPLYVLMLVVIALFSNKGIATEFIYFKF